MFPNWSIYPNSCNHKSPCPTAVGIRAFSFMTNREAAREPQNLRRWMMRGSKSKARFRRKVVSLAPFYQRNSGVKAFIVTSVATACIQAHNRSSPPYSIHEKNLCFFWAMCYNVHTPRRFVVLGVPVVLLSWPQYGFRRTGAFFICRWDGAESSESLLSSRILRTER